MGGVIPALSMCGIEAGYHRGVPVLRDVTLHIQAGEMVGILGPNGAGKTTLLRCMTGLCRPTAGTVALFGRDLNTLRPSERARCISVVPQEVETPMAFSVGQLVMIGRTAALSAWSAPSASDHRIVERAMAYTDVVHLKSRPFSELSGGEKQRVVVAMALAQEPRMIVMDEATSHLDMNHRLELMQIVRRMNREHGTTVLMISHDLNLTAEFCSRMVLLDQGRVSADGTPAEVLTEGRLQQVYHCDVRVQTNPASGIVAVFPTPRWLAAGSGRGVRVHIICGGGTGEEIIRRLHLADYTVTCGVLNRGDTDADTALALGIETAMERPFSPVTEAPYQIALPWIEAADTVIVSGVPFGPGNLRNLDLADRALQAGKRVMIMAGVAERDYTPDRQATLYSRRLRDRGAVEWRNIAELFTGLQP